MLGTIFRRILFGVLTAGVAGAMTAGAAGPLYAQGKRMVFATMGSGTMYYTLGSGFSKMLTEKLNRRVTVQPYTGSSVYLPLVNQGEATLAFSSSLDADAAYRGTDRAALKDLRAIARIWPLKVAFMVRQSSGIRTIQDLKGKRVTVNFKGQRAMSSVTRAMLATGGLSDKDVKSITVGNVGAGSKALIEGNVDASFIAVGIPLVKQAHAAIPGGVTYVDLSTGNTSPAFLSSQVNGVYATTVAPAKRLPEVKAKITTTAFDIFLLTSAKTPDADVAAVLKAVHENFAGLQKSYPPLRRGNVKGFASPTNTTPYHPAAAAYYKSKGMWTAANDAKEKSLAK